MPIPVICAGCKTRFTVSEQFAGRTGPCPKCKAPITVPKAAASVTIHEPEAPAATGASGRAPTAPIVSTEKPVDQSAFIVVGCGAVAAMAAAFLCRLAWGPGDVPAGMLAIGAIGPALPAAWVGYRLVRDRELEPYRGRSLILRCAICGGVYAALWGMHALLPLEIRSDPWQWIYLGPAFGFAGALAALAALDLDWGSAAVHYALYVMFTAALRSITGLAPI